MKQSLRFLILMTLITLPSIMGHASIADFIGQPEIEKGSYSFTEQDLQNYYSNQSETRGIIRLQTPLKDPIFYKINERQEFQAQNWYEYYRQLENHQHRWIIDSDAFVQKFEGRTFNDAKKNFFSKLNFNLKNYLHDHPYVYLKEWGNLNHPPFKNLSPENLEKFSPYFKKIDYKDPKLNSSPYFNPDFQLKVDKASQSELTSQNTFDLLADNKSFEEKRRAIGEAKKSIWVSSLVFVNDVPTQQIAQELIQKSHEGLDVRIIDEGSLRYLDPTIVSLLKKNKLKVVDADDFFNYNSEAIYHSKVIITDENQAIVGGQNMIDADLGSKGTDFKNRDVDVKITGPLVTDVIFNYMEDWNHFVVKKSKLSDMAFTKIDFQNVKNRKAQESERGLRGPLNYPHWLNDSKNRMTGLGRYIAQKPYKNQGAITEAYLIYLDGVRGYVAITNPITDDTFSMSKGSEPLYKRQENFNRLFVKVQDLLKNPQIHLDYLTSGADFELNEMVPMTLDRIYGEMQKNETLLANLNQVWMDKTNLLLAPKSYEHLINDFGSHSNVDSWIYISFMHSKIFYFDRIAASVGSFNFQHNATDHAYESTIIVQDADFNRSLDETLTLDMANSAPFIYKDLSGLSPKRQRAFTPGPL